MNEVSVALQMSSDRSLIILDELGQGTNLDEGTSLGWAIVEGFLLSRAFVLFATHIFPLTRLSELYPQIVKYVHIYNSLLRLQVYLHTHTYLKLTKKVYKSDTILLFTY